MHSLRRPVLQIGEFALVHAVGSGVGLAASQLIHAAGATVIGTSRTAEKLDRAREYGMDHGIAVGDDPSTIASKVHELTHGKGVNVVLDLVGAAYLSASIESLALRGRMLQVGTTSGGQATLEYGPVMSKRLTIIGTVLRARSQEEKATATRLFEQHVVPLLESGTVRPVVDKIYELKDIRAAHEQMEGNRSFGKIVVVME
jgi:NADPH:quinone reductase-like Zn-dependent oxidoreductase